MIYTNAELVKKFSNLEMVAKFKVWFGAEEVEKFFKDDAILAFNTDKTYLYVYAVTPKTTIKI